MPRSSLMHRGLFLGGKFISACYLYLRPLSSLSSTQHHSTLRSRTALFGALFFDKDRGAILIAQLDDQAGVLIGESIDVLMCSLGRQINVLRVEGEAFWVLVMSSSRFC